MKRIEHLSLILLLFLSLNFSLFAQETKESSEFKLAVNLYNDNMYDLALDQFKNFINAYPNSNQAIEARYYIGLVQFKLRKYEEARVSFQNFALSYTDNSKAADAWYKVGESYVALKNYREAALAFERVKVFHPKSQIAPEALLKSAEYFKKDSDLINARKNLQSIMQDYSSSEFVQPARLSLAELHLEEGNIALAQNETRRVAESESKFKPDALILMGKINILSGQYDEAEKNFLRIIKEYKISPAVSHAYYELGILYRELNDFPKAISQLEKVVADKETNITLKEKTVFELGITYFESSDFKNALKSFDNFVRTFYESERLNEAMLWAGKSADGAKNFKSALSWYDKIFVTKKYDEISAQALIRASYSAEQSGSISMAIEYCKRFFQNYTDHNGRAEASIRIAGLLKNELKDFIQAIKYYEEAIHFLEQQPTESLQRRKISSLKLDIAECYAAAGFNEYAIQSYEEIINNYPSDLEALTAEEKLETIKIFTGKDYKTVTEKTARLIGDFLTEKPKGEVAFNLAEVYYHDLKDYSSAAEFYTLALNNGINADRSSIAAFNRADAMTNLSLTDTSYLKPAVNYSEYFITNYPLDEKFHEAKYKLLTLKLKTSSSQETEILLSEFISRFPKSNLIPHMIKLRGDNYYDLKNYTDALSTYRRINIDYPSSKVAEEANFLLGKIFYETGKNDSAISILSELIEKYPHGLYTAGAMKMLGTAYINQDRYNDAVEVIKRLIEEFYYTEVLNGAEHLYSEALIGSGNYDKAANFLQTLIQNIENNPFVEKIDYELILSLAKVYDKKGEYQRATPLYYGCLKNADSKSRYSEIYIALGNIAKAQGEGETAAAYYKLAGKFGDPKTIKDIADLMFKNSKYQEAENYYKDLLQNSTNEDDKKYYQSRIIVCLLKRDDLKQAQNQISDFEKKYKKSVEYIAEFEYEKALHYYRSQDLTRAKKTFENVADDYDKTEFAPLAEYYLGMILETNKKLPDAIKKYESILKRHPNSTAAPRVLLALGNISYTAEKFEDAIRYYQRIVEAPEKAGDILPYAMTNLIEAYESTKLFDAALKLTRDFVERFPKDSSVPDKRVKIGILYTRLEYYDQAILHLQSMLDLLGSDYETEIRYNLGETYYYKGDYQQAILEFLKVPYIVNAKGAEYWTATSLYMAGQAYERMGKYDKAISMYQQIIDRPGIDVNFKAGAHKEIDRIKSIIK